MKPLKIVKDSNPLLRKKSEDVVLPLSNEDKKIILEMFEYLKNSQDDEYRKQYPTVREGIGLAAPQIGILKKMLVVYMHIDDKEISHALVNPKIISTSVKKCYLEKGEGCLSVDKDHRGYVFRNYKIKISAYDAIKDKEVIIVAKDVEAIALQHELDHLSGILYYDHINKMNPTYAPEEFIKI